MQYTITINQAKSVEWGLNPQQALLFAFVYECPSWARMMRTDDGEFYALSKAKIIEELPILTDKPDTAYRLLKQLDAIGLIEISHTATITLVRITRKGKEWNRKLDGSEKYPTSTTAKVGKISDAPRKNIRPTSEKNPTQPRKKIRAGSEKSPTNHETSNQVTSNQGTSQVLQAGPAAQSQPAALTLVVDQPRCDIPADMPGPKDQSCKTFKAWANYAMAYRKRYQAWPVWNAKVAGQIGQLVDRLGADIAHHVAAYFVGINDSRLINGCHSIGDLLVRAEAYHTQWATNRQMNATTAQQQERKQANLNAGQEAAQRILSREERRANDFL
ncbi:phage replication protein [Pseudomonas oryzihabitans]|uniref:phage replication protein n=1 Tax=Pseudomonas oryzihabitans TaxID=47885 RepID=UPI002894DF92|nr:phage replication protein [Pseudomonas oryzihabitans]MDT3718463.1 phage replication protein [Pseudomonas oryzihabitans]